MIWISSAVYKILSWFMKDEDLELLKFFIPLILQIKAFAIQTGEGSVRMGLIILKDAALKAVSEAAQAEGNKVKVAEQIFLDEVKASGIEAINNAAAGLIKAAVAELQTGIINAELAKISQTPKVPETK
jgi:hypothetical protein